MTTVLRLLLVVAAGWLVAWVAARVLPFSVVSASGRAVLLVVSVSLGLAVAAWAWRGMRRGAPDRAARALVVGTAVLVSGMGTIALHGTRWGFSGLSADASFRTEAATRYADTWRLADYAYAATPAYYPPALSWVRGRAAAVLDVPAWATAQPVQLVLAALVPLLAFWLWRRLVPPVHAAVVVALTALLTADLMKVDEWLVLVCAVPWWMDLVRGVRREGVTRWPWWGHGLFAGAILLTHTFYLLPLAAATVLGWGVDLVRRRRPELGPARVVGVVVVGVLVAAPYWLPTVRARLAGAPSDDLQLRYTFPGANVPPWPLPTDVAGALGLVGVLWLAWSWREWRRGRTDPTAPLAASVALLLVASYLTMLVGAVAIRFDIGLLTFKTDELVILAMAVAGASGLVAAARSSRWRSRPRLVLAVAAVVVVAVTLDFSGHWVVGAQVRAAQTTRYPDGGFPEGGRGLPRGVDGPAFEAVGDPSVAQVRSAWEETAGRPLDSATVLVTSRVDLLATTPFHLFLTWKSIYSNPLGRFEGRYDLLREVAACGDPLCAHDLLTDNPYDRVDGLVLERRDDELVMPILVDDFPDRSRTTEIAFPSALFAAADFEVAEVGRIAVVVLR